MTDDPRSDVVEFDEILTLALAGLTAGGPSPRPEVRQRLMSSISAPPAETGFAFRFAADAGWMPHPVPGIRMKVLALNRAAGYATLLLDVAPGTRFPAHHHGGAEECYVLSGSLYTCGRRMSAGDFLHADAHTDHGELVSEEGCRVLLIVPPDDDIPEPSL
jgi:anti-sigma factor ChrR (cupin superfamily)